METHHKIINGDSRQMTELADNSVHLASRFKALKLIFLILFSTLVSKAQENNMVNAYDSMHRVVSAAYPMSKWKSINWGVLNAAIRPKVLSSAAVNDSIAFYTSLQEYTTSLHDGHTNIRHGWEKIRAASMYREIGGSYGFAVILLDDGCVVAKLVNPGSPAALAGMQFGASILEVNDSPVREILDTVSVLWSEIVPATHETKMLNQCRFIGRAPIGSSIKIKFVNKGAAYPITALLTAIDDNYETYNQTTLYPKDNDPAVIASILQPSGYGYIKVNTLYGDSIDATRQIYTSFRDAINNFNLENVLAIVLDFRVNGGGFDALAAALSGFFYDHVAFYERQLWYNPDLDSLETVPEPVPHFDSETLDFELRPGYPDGEVYTEPQGVYFSKPIIVLTGPRAISSGEGIPMMLQKLPQCKVQSFYGSNGSFVLVGYQHYFFPNDSFYIRYPYGVAADSTMKIMLDGDSTMIGGVVPDYRVPLNDSTIHQLYVENIDVELQFAIKTLNDMSLGIENHTDTREIILHQNYPNPFNSTTFIKYEIVKQMKVQLKVLDIQGKEVTTLVNEVMQAGNYEVKFDGSKLASGIYYYNLQTEGFNETKKFVLINREDKQLK